MLYSERAVTSMAKRLVFLFQQVSVRYPCVTDSKSGHDRLLLTTERSSCAAQTLFQVWKYLVQFVSDLTIPEFLSNCINVHIYLSFRSDQPRCDRAAKLDVKAAFASPSALSFPQVPTCEGIQITTTWACGGNFLSRL